MSSGQVEEQRVSRQEETWGAAREEPPGSRGAICCPGDCGGSSPKPLCSPSQRTLQMHEARGLESRGFRKIDQTPPNMQALRQGSVTAVPRWAFLKSAISHVTPGGGRRQGRRLINLALTLIPGRPGGPCGQERKRPQCSLEDPSPTSPGLPSATDSQWTRGTQTESPGASTHPQNATRGRPVLSTT